jgi:hypothetical protein
MQKFLLRVFELTSTNRPLSARDVKDAVASTLRTLELTARCLRPIFESYSYVRLSNGN